MYAIKAVLLKLAWVATLHLRHTAMMISFDRLFFHIQNDRYQTWGYCAEIMSAAYVWSNAYVGAHKSNHLAATLNMWHIGIRQHAEGAWNRREREISGKTCHTPFHTSRCRAVTRDTISHGDRLAPQKTTHLFGKAATGKLRSFSGCIY